MRKRRKYFATLLRGIREKLQAALTGDFYTSEDLPAGVWKDNLRDARNMARKACAR